MSRRSRFVHTLPRRRFLLGAGVGLLAAPFYRLVQASGEVTPLPRFVTVVHPLGFIGGWDPIGDPGPLQQMGPLAESLEPFREKLTFIMNLRHTTSHYTHLGAHNIGFQGATTAVLNRAEAKAEGISIDQHVVEGWQPTEPVRSLALGVLGRNNISYRAGGEPINRANNAQTVFNTLFAGVAGGDAALAEVRGRRKSVMDAWTDELGQLAPKLSSEHRIALDAHLERIRDLELLLDAGLTGCAPPQGIEQSGDFYNNTQNMPIITKQMIDILAAAFACGMTRVASLALGQHNSRLRFPWVNAGEHHGLTHGSNTNARREEFGRIVRWYTEQVAYLLERLDGVLEGSGTMLDNTLVYWNSECGYRGSHSAFNYNVMLAGNPGGYFDVGKKYVLPGSEQSQTPVNSVLAEIATGLGVPTAQFGPQGGQLPEIRA